MKTKIIAFLLAAASVAQLNADTAPGMGTKQTQRTILGTILGGTVGGVVGHQHDKQKEGILIGSVVGGLIGNRNGANADHRREKAQQEQTARERYFARRQAEQRRHYDSLSRQDTRFHPKTTSYGYPQPNISGAGAPHLDPDVVAAPQRAEQAEFELQRQLEARRRLMERERMLQEFRNREAAARQELNNMR